MNKHIVRFLPLAVLVIVTGSCQSIPKMVADPVVTLDSVSLLKIDFDGVDMLAKLAVKNPNPFAIPFPEIDWTLFISDRSFLNGTIKKGTKIAANGTTGVDIPFTISYKGLFSLVSALLDADHAPYRVNAGARFDIPVLGSRRFQAEFSGTIPLLRLPSISFDKIQFNSLTPLKVEFVLSWAVENKNVFAIAMDRLSYNFFINNVSWARATAPVNTQLPAKTTTRIPLTVSVNSLPLINEILSIVASGKKASFSGSGDAALRPRFEGLDPIILPFSFSGETNFRN